MLKSWRRASTGKIWSRYHLKITDITEKEIGKKTLCGMCGKESEKGYHLTTYIRDSGDGDLIPDYASLSPKIVLMSLETHQMPELRRVFGVLDGLSATAMKWLDFMNWFVNDCCRAKFRRECCLLGFKVDREELSRTSRHSLDQCGLRREKRRR